MLIAFGTAVALHFAGSIRLWMWWDHHWIDVGTVHYYAGSLTLCYEFPLVWIPVVCQIEGAGYSFHGYHSPGDTFSDIPWRSPLPFFWAANAIFWGVAAAMALRKFYLRRSRHAPGGFEVVHL